MLYIKAMAKEVFMPKLSLIEAEANNHQKLINNDLANLCKLPDSDGDILNKIEQLLLSGAEAVYCNGKPLYNATRKLNFKTVYKLIEYGALQEPNAKNYIASICDYRNFSKNEEKFFNLIDFCIEKTGFDIAYFIPYINTMFLHGQPQKTNILISKYGLKPKQIIDEVYERVIFEIINNGHENTLAYIERYREWINQSCFDTAISGGETKVLKYILSKDMGFVPQESSICKAIYDGYTDVLDTLKEHGYALKKEPAYLKRACRSFLTNGKKAFEYLIQNGFSLTDCYDGKTVYENAVIDGNRPLLEYLRLHGVSC